MVYGINKQTEQGRTREDHRGLEEAVGSTPVALEHTFKQQGIERADGTSITGAEQCSGEAGLSLNPCKQACLRLLACADLRAPDGRCLVPSP